MQWAALLRILTDQIILLLLGGNSIFIEVVCDLGYDNLSFSDRNLSQEMKYRLFKVRYNLIRIKT